MYKTIQSNITYTKQLQKYIKIYYQSPVYQINKMNLRKSHVFSFSFLTFKEMISKRNKTSTYNNY